MTQVDLRKTSLDKDLKKITRLEEAGQNLARSLMAPGLGFLFLAAIGLIVGFQISAEKNAILIVIAAILGGYMAMNIGANDVANNVGPAVGSNALSMFGALVIAATFECMGALLAGGDVVKTISKGIVDPALVPNSETFVLAMMAALLSAALWVNLATYLNAPVSTTHAVVGGVAGAGVAAVGWDVVNWTVMSTIAASWVVSPFLGGAIAALFLAFIKTNIIYQDDKIAAAQKWIPLLIAIMAAAFSFYLIVKGLKQIWQPEVHVAASISVAIFFLVWISMRPLIVRQSEGMENRNQSLRRLFHLPLICSAALLSFAHGANDLANAVGPLAAIYHSATYDQVAAKVEVPVWIMMIGAFGISLGLMLYGPRLIRVVGSEISKMNPMRAYCVALSAAITVIVASAFGLPVSSTHIAVGAVFGVGFFREFYTARSKRRRAYVRSHARRHASRETHGSDSEKRTRRKLVRRSHFMVIVAAWLITVPSAAALAAIVYHGLTMAF
ncbi:MAG: hypothetical protein RLZ98_616 [Pseudomonadota bacterium]|jgi:PiT family inorganic phosphate transporter